MIPAYLNEVVTNANIHLQSSSSRLSPSPRAERYRLHSPSSRTNSPAESLRSHDDDFVDVVQWNGNSPRPIWHKPPPSSNLQKDRASPSSSQSASALSLPPTTNGRIKTDNFRTSKPSNDHHHDHHSHTDISHASNSTEERERPLRPSSTSSNEQSSPTPSRTSSPRVINNTYRIDLRHASRSPSPPVSSSKERNGVKTSTSTRKQETPKNEDFIRDRDMESDGMLFSVR